MTAPHQWDTAVLYARVEGGVECTLCPHRCVLADGETGLCRVRRRRGDALETATRNGIAVSHVDPVERKPFYHVRPGRRAVTLAAPGCTFLCGYCINAKLSQYGRPAGSPWSGRPVELADVVRQAGQIDGLVALSYTEPALAAELTLALAAAGVQVLWKSNGFLTPEAIDLLAPALLAVNVDIKAADEDRHRRLTGAPLAPVLDCVRRLRDHGVWVEVSTPLIPGVSDAPADLAWIADTLVSIDGSMPWHLLRFTPTFRMADEKPTAPALLDTAVHIGQSAGLRHVYVERALGDAGRTTYCPRCQAAVITREVWGEVASRLAGGRCPDCATVIDGRW